MDSFTLAFVSLLDDGVGWHNRGTSKMYWWLVKKDEEELIFYNVEDYSLGYLIG